MKKLVFVKHLDHVYHKIYYLTSNPENYEKNWSLDNIKFRLSIDDYNYIKKSGLELKPLKANSDLSNFLKNMSANIKFNYKLPNGQVARCIVTKVMELNDTLSTEEIVHSFKKSKTDHRFLILTNETWRRDLEFVVEYISYTNGIYSAYGSLFDSGAFVESKAYDLPYDFIKSNNLFEPQIKKYYHKKAIKEIIDKRNIKYLVHFTDKQNIENIKKHGILSVMELSYRNIPYKANDLRRLDNLRDHISTSISHCNYYLLNNFLRNRTIINPCIIYIDPAVLYDINSFAIFCDRNAATINCKKGHSAEYLENMFCKTLSYSTTLNSFNYNRHLDKREPYETTDPQAEILISTQIPTKYIIDIKELSYGN